jgi:hypothetical protein
VGRATELLQSMNGSLVHQGSDACFGGDHEWDSHPVVWQLSMRLAECGDGISRRMLPRIVNGEIHNYRALRQELMSAGYKFLTRSDTDYSDSH